MRLSLSTPPTEILDAARLLDAAVTAHLLEQHRLADELIRTADMPEIYRWLKPIWSDNERHVVIRDQKRAPGKAPRLKARMPTVAEKEQVRKRDRYNCRFCGMPVIRSEVRARIRLAYPSSARWGRKESEQHAAFQAMWAQYDHSVPHAMGGTNDLDNIVLACAACNFGRGSYSLEEVGLADPRLRPPQESSWDGLERFR